MESHFGQRFGVLIARKREERGWSLAQLAVAAYGDDSNGGETRKADVQKLEAGNSRKPNAATIRKYRLALDLTQEEIDACRTPEEIELAQFAKALFDVIAEGAKAAGLTEDLALAVSENYAENNHGNFKGALASLKDALSKAAEAQRRGDFGSNFETDAEKFIQHINARNREGEIDEAYTDLQAEAASRAERREAMLAEDTRILDLLITQAAMANDADGYAQAQLQRVQLDSPSAEDTFKRLRALQGERYEEGLRLGTPFALTAAAGLARKCAEIAPTPYRRTMAQNDLAIALEAQGIRTQGAAGNTLLTEAVDSYRAALRVYIEADHPVDWAMTMQNLGGALQTQGSRTQGAKGHALLTEATDSYRSALRVFTEADHPVDWAGTMQNLAVALETQGSRTDGPEGPALLAEAVESYRSALRVYTEAERPVQWAGTMQNLAIALKNQGTITQGAEGNALLADAVDSYRSALRVTTEEDHPVQWAMTMQNLAIAQQNQGTRTQGAAGNALLKEAMESYRAALRVRTEADHPVDWAMTQENLAVAEVARAAHDTTPDPRPHLDAALIHVDNALRIYDPVHMSYDHARAARLRTEILKALDALPPSSSS
ncbi:hypothetical protein KUL25_03275 [Rhodobacteraceae bacterium N5(2021)]|uniref:HTH cro/C1-type domain-containing protein n=1 Tax=Gymnodinialimonas phycosphaerae TaxID=2841589 RepID=A0A975TVN7_9RHOB|nr:hypothetical protein [Gymnodinialimonas phycosphaerae]MBY4891784.1 hypothetical protein [Gymnodinialimonas phycosphaerae]